MRVLICAVGSHGDLLPFIGLAGALQRRGHDVRLYSNGHFAGMARLAGVPFVVTSDARLFEDALADRRATQTRAGLKLIAEGTIATVLPTFEAMAADVLPGETLLVGSSLGFAPRLLAEAQGLPFAAVHLSPSMFRSAWQTPRLGAVRRAANWPRALKRALYAVADRWFLDPAFARPLDRIRADLRLPPVRRIFQHWLHEGAARVGMFPEWFAAPQPDWPTGVVLTGFPMHDGGEVAALEPALRAFLAAGPAPVVFTAGTANTTSEPFYAESARACERLGRRGVLVAADRAQLPAALPPGVIHVAFAPFSRLLPHAAALVHHGGIGTLSQALRAGTPQLIRPMAYDQFDNAARAVDLGVAQELLPAACRGARLDRALTDLLGNPAVRVACRALAERMAGQDGLEATCRVLETVFADAPGAGSGVR